MPLLGTLSSDALHQILEAASSAQSNAVLHIHTPHEQGAITIVGGQVTQITHKHQQLDAAMTALLSARQGHFQLCQAGEPAPATDTPSVWLIDRKATRSQGVAAILNELHYETNVVIDLDHATALLPSIPPDLLLLEGALAAEQQNAILSTLKSIPTTQLPKIMLIGPPSVVPAPFEAIGAEWFAWPATYDEVKQRISRWVQPRHNPEQQALSALELLASFAPFTPEIKVRLHPMRRNELKQNGVSSQWTAWLETLTLEKPLQFYLKRAPGPQEFARVMVYNLMQLGLLTTQDLSGEDELMADATEAPAPLQLHKVISLGLRGTWKEDWIKSLKKISQNQATRIPREHPFPVPYLPKIEHARIPLRTDTLLVAYGARNEEIIDQIIEKTNQHITGFLYFAEYDNAEELQHIRFMRQSLEDRFQSKHLFMIAAPTSIPLAELRNIAQIQPDDLIVSIQRFDLNSTHTALQTLLQSFTKK